MNAMQLAAKIVNDGFAKFIGDGITVEIATRGVINGHRIANAGGWVEFKTIKPVERKTNNRANMRPDTIRPEICRVSPPGSSSRITNLAAYYASLPRQFVPSDENDKRGSLEPSGESAFTNDIAEDLAQLLPCNGYRPHTVNLTGGLGAARHRRKTKKLGE